MQTPTILLSKTHKTVGRPKFMGKKSHNAPSLDKATEEIKGVAKRRFSLLQ